MNFTITFPPYLCKTLRNWSIKVSCFISLIIIFDPLSSQSQDVVQHSLWFSWVNKQKITDHIGLHFDVQIRSSDDVGYLRNVVLRPGITYFFDSDKNATLGYAYILTHQELAGMPKISLNEHRVWEQFNWNLKVGQVPP